MSIITLDIETSITFDKAKEVAGDNFDPLKVFATYPWIAVTNHDGVITNWWHEEAEELLEELLKTDVVTGWNINAFDIPIIRAGYHHLISSHSNLTPAQQRKLNEYIYTFPVEDVFQFACQSTVSDTHKHGMSYSLAEVCIANGLEPKRGDSADIPALFQAGDMTEVFARCEQHVKLEREIYDLFAQDRLILPAKTSKQGHVPESILKRSQFI